MTQWLPLNLLDGDDEVPIWGGDEEVPPDTSRPRSQNFNDSTIFHVAEEFDLSVRLAGAGVLLRDHDVPSTPAVMDDLLPSPSAVKKAEPTSPSLSPDGPRSPTSPTSPKATNRVIQLAKDKGLLRRESMGGFAVPPEQLITKQQAIIRGFLARREASRRRQRKAPAPVTGNSAVRAMYIRRLVAPLEKGEVRGRVSLQVDELWSRTAVLFFGIAGEEAAWYQWLEVSNVYSLEQLGRESVLKEEFDAISTFAERSSALKQSNEAWDDLFAEEECLRGTITDEEDSEWETLAYSTWVEGLNQVRAAQRRRKSYWVDRVTDCEARESDARRAVVETELLSRSYVEAYETLFSQELEGRHELNADQNLEWQAWCRGQGSLLLQMVADLEVLIRHRLVAGATAALHATEWQCRGGVVGLAEGEGRRALDAEERSEYQLLAMEVEVMVGEKMARALLEDEWKDGHVVLATDFFGCGLGTRELDARGALTDCETLVWSELETRVDLEWGCCLGWHDVDNAAETLMLWGDVDHDRLMCGRAEILERDDILKQHHHILKSNQERERGAAKRWRDRQLQELLELEIQEDMTRGLKKTEEVHALKGLMSYLRMLDLQLVEERFRSKCTKQADKARKGLEECYTRELEIEQIVQRQWRQALPARKKKNKKNKRKKYYGTDEGENGTQSAGSRDDFNSTISRGPTRIPHPGDTPTGAGYRVLDSPDRGGDPWGQSALPPFSPGSGSGPSSPPVVSGARHVSRRDDDVVRRRSNEVSLTSLSAEAPLSAASPITTTAAPRGRKPPASVPVRLGDGESRRRKRAIATKFGTGPVVGSGAEASVALPPLNAKGGVLRQLPPFGLNRVEEEEEEEEREKREDEGSSAPSNEEGGRRAGKKRKRKRAHDTLRVASPDDGTNASSSVTHPVMGSHLLPWEEATTSGFETVQGAGMGLRSHDSTPQTGESRRLLDELRASGGH